MKNRYALLFVFLFSFTLNAQIIDIPDANFKNALIENGVDTNGDGEISTSEAEAITSLSLVNRNMASLEGIEYFTNINYLNCTGNQLTSIDVSQLDQLFGLVCHNNMLSSINVDNNLLMNSLGCANNLIAVLNVDNNTMLTSLSCYDNLITSLDLTNNTILENLRCDNNQITEITFGTITGNISMGTVFTLNCSNNLLTTLDLSSVHMTQHGINVSNNQLTSLILKNGVTNVYDYPELFGQVSLINNPDLTFICVDPSEISYIQNQAASIPNCVVNSYCSFVPGGDYYTVEGGLQFDSNSDGCDMYDVSFPNLKFTVTNGSQTGSFIANTSGNYTIPVQEGVHTITPVIENIGYFTVSPPNMTVSYPADTSPFVQDFCIVPNGIFNDLEITILPLEAARPGFDTDYKIVYKNKGTTSLTGNINFGFQDEVMEFISSTPANESGLTDLLTYNFTDLASFESREVLLTMNLNSPMETPALNGGEVLTFITSISSSETDETPDDNTFELHQTVVNSFDPNDKTCLEGAFITPEMVGEYVHYMIRFENTGTADAINIVVKDHIDRTKYDLSSLVALEASHDFVARIKDDASDYYVEFIFENINLPFDDATNDGYVVFKIRTLDTLMLNDTFENEAEIYFDFNFPIITNVAQTTVATLSTEEFEIANNALSLYPNPTTHSLHLNSKQPIKQIAVYDISGRHIENIAVIGLKTNITISTEALSSGTYFIKIKTTQGDTIKKVIKD
jgi:hypothetical protein